SEGLGGSRGGLDAELHGDVFRRLAALDGDGHRVAGLRARYGCGEVVGGGRRVAVEGGDDVTDLQARLRGRRAGDNLRDPGAARHALDPDAEVGVLHRAARDDRLGDALRPVDRDGEADAGVVVRGALDVVV